MTLSDQAFANAGPSMWNKLATWLLECFKSGHFEKQLNTHLYLYYIVLKYESPFHSKTKGLCHLPYPAPRFPSTAIPSPSFPSPPLPSITTDSMQAKNRILPHVEVVRYIYLLYCAGGQKFTRFSFKQSVI